MKALHLPQVLCDVDAGDPFRAVWPDLERKVALEFMKSETLLAGATAVIVRRRRLSESDLVRAPNLRWVSAWGVGFDHIDVEAATRLGIPVSFNPVFTTSMAEAALTLMLALAKRLPELSASTRSDGGDVGSRGDADRNTELEGKALGIVGFGRIGRRIGQLGRCLGMKVIATDPLLVGKSTEEWYRLEDLPVVLSESDVVVLAAPLTPNTYHLIDDEQLRRMRPNAYLINVGRGGLVDEEALHAALVSGQLAGAGLDVWEHEPVRPDHPLLALSNVIGTDHALGRSHESLQRICLSITQNIQRVLAGDRPLTVLNPEVWQNENS